MSGQIFVDETKHRDYLMVAAVVLPADVAPVRWAVRGLVLPGQRRVHMSKESAPRRRLIAETIAGSGVTAVIFDAGQIDGDELERRRACLRAVVAHSDDLGAGRLVLELDDSLLCQDRRWLVEITRELGCRDILHYDHARAAAEPLLAVPDAIAWCWAKGGDWRRRIRPAVTGVELV